MIILLWLIAVSYSQEFIVYVNNVSPYHNPSETYRYYLLPFCSPKKMFSGEQTLGQSLSGDRKMASLYKMTFKVDMNRTRVCEKQVSEEQMYQFKDVIEQNYVAEFYIGDFRMHDFIGEKKGEEYYLKTHIEFNVYYSSNEQYVGFYHANISHPVSEDFTRIEGRAMNVTFEYSVRFWEVRDKKTITQADDFELEGTSDIDWSALLVKCLFILAMATLICWQVSKMLRRDFIQLADEENEREDDIGWKLIKREALRSPKYKIVLSACIGTGYHFLILVVIQIVLGILGIYYGHKGTIKTTGLVIYAFTGYFNGYYSAKYYKYFGGKKWTTSMAVSTCLFPGSMVTNWFTVNSLAWYSNSTATIPFSALFLIGFLWGIIYLPFTMIGYVSGRLRTIDQLPNSSQKNIEKPIPQKDWSNKGVVNFLICGLVSFSSVYIEIKHIYNSAWGHYTFHLYGMIFLGYILLVLVVCCLSIYMTYQQLKNEDYNWQWASFRNGGSISVFVIMYSLYYYMFESNMYGLIQASFFYAYTFLASFVSFMMFGTCAFIASLQFVFYIYTRSTLD